MPGYSNSMGSISFCGRTTVLRDTNSDDIQQLTKPLWHIKFSDGTDAKLRGKTIQEVIDLTCMERIVYINKVEEE